MWPITQDLNWESKQLNLVACFSRNVAIRETSCTRLWEKKYYWIFFLLHCINFLLLRNSQLWVKQKVWKLNDSFFLTNLRYLENKELEIKYMKHPKYLKMFQTRLIKLRIQGNAHETGMFYNQHTCMYTIMIISNNKHQVIISLLFFRRNFRLIPSLSSLQIP